MKALFASNIVEEFKPPNEWFKYMLKRNPVSLHDGIARTVREYKKIYFSKKSMATHERLTALYDAIKQKADEQGVSPGEIAKIRDLFFKFSDDKWHAHEAFWKPTGLIFGFPFPEGLQDQFDVLRTDILAKLGLKPNQYWLPDKKQLHLTVISYSHYSGSGLSVIPLPLSEIPKAKKIVGEYNPIEVSFRGALITNNGSVFAKGFVDDEALFSLRNELISKIEGITQQTQDLVHVKLAQILDGNIYYETTELANRLYSSLDLGRHIFNEARTPGGESLRLG